MKYIDDENLEHKIFKKRKKWYLESDIIVFGQFMDKKYQSKSKVTYGPLDSEDNAINLLKSFTISLREIK